MAWKVIAQSAVALLAGHGFRHNAPMLANGAVIIFIHA
jgi:hypothetical protein